MSLDAGEHGADGLDGVQRRRPEDDLEVVEPTRLKRPEAVRDLRRRSANRDAEHLSRARERGRLHDDAGRSSDRRRIPADFLTSGLERGEARTELREVASLFDEPAPDVRMQGGQAEHLGTLGADHDRDPSGPRTDGSVLEVPSRVEGALEIGVAISKQRQDDPEGLLEAPDGSIFRQAERMALAAGVTGAQAE